MTGADSFLSRWSRRKRLAEPDPPASPPVEAEAAAPPDLAPPPEPVLSDEELAALPRIEDLTPDTDIRGFLRPGVPAALKNAAMRRMWLLTPAIRDYRDPAVDYAWDWNTPGGVPGDGCAPSPERAAEMLRELLDPPKPAPSESGADPQAEPADEAAAALPPAEDRPSAPDTPAEAEKPGFANTMPDVAPPRRRHGGALPS